MFPAPPPVWDTAAPEGLLNAAFVPRPSALPALPAPATVTVTQPVWGTADCEGVGDWVGVLVFDGGAS